MENTKDTSSNQSPAPQKSSTQSKSQTLTQHLLASDTTALRSATQTPFLTHSGRGTLPKHTLSQWLSQDRLYAQAYISFIGALISRIELPTVRPSDKSQSLNWRIVNLLHGSLANIFRELEFFDDVAHRYGLELNQVPDGEEGKEGEGEFQPVQATKEYVELFRSFGTEPGKGLLEGLVVLWATEVCYLTAWRFAKAQGENSAGKGEGEGDEDGGALRREFIPNWTSDEFEKFVDDIAEVTDQLAESEDVSGKGGAGLGKCVEVWDRVLDIEKRFWPTMKS